MTLTKDLYWATGFLDGEGCFGFWSNGKRHRLGVLRVTASQNDTELLCRLRNIFGGSVSKSSGLGQWSLHGPKAAGVMMTLFSLLSDKRQKEICKALAAWKAAGNSKSALTKARNLFVKEG